MENEPFGFHFVYRDDDGNVVATLHTNTDTFSQFLCRELVHKAMGLPLENIYRQPDIRYSARPEWETLEAFHTPSVTMILDDMLTAHVVKYDDGTTDSHTAPVRQLHQTTECAEH